MDHPSELSDAITQIINALSSIQTASEENQYSLQTYALRLEVLVETSLASVDIPLEVVDLLNSARTYLKNACGSPTSEFSSYQAPLTRNRERGRPKFVISEEQLEFFKGMYINCKDYMQIRKTIQVVVVEGQHIQICCTENPTVF